MKIYKFSQPDVLHLRDIIDSISYFYVVDDVICYNYGQITASENPDEEFYSSLPEDKLLEVLNDPDSDISNIEDIHTLDRIAKLKKSRLSARQLNKLKAEYKKQIAIDDEDRKYLLQLFKQCNSIYVADRDKNLRFKSEYHLSDNEILNILHNLQLSDFRYKSKSVNYNHLGNNVVILKPKIVIPGEDTMVGVNLYIKLDLDYEDRSCVAFVSIHPEERTRNRRH